jgi:hypothetical protein
MTLSFLVFLNRSGSTLLARMLDEYDDIGVTPEARFPDGITCRERVIRNNQDIDGFLEELYRDDRFRSWNIKRENLQKTLWDHQKPIHFKHMLPLLMKAYFQNDPSTIYVYKSPYVFDIEKVRRMFPEAKFIMIIRDLRAIYASQKKTRGTDLGRPMATDPIKPALYYNLAGKLVQRYRSKPWFRCVKFEDLVIRPEGIIDDLVDFLGASRVKSNNATEYFEKLSESQKTIHQNIQSPPLPERIHAWRKGIDQKELYVLQRIAQKSIRFFGYEMVGTTRLTAKEQRTVFSYFFKFLLTFYNKYRLFRVYTKALIRR